MCSRTRGRQLGITSQDIAAALNSLVGGSTITQIRDDIYLVNVVGRARYDERGSLETLQNLQLPGRNGQSIPLAAIATFRYEIEQPIVWRRSRVPTITVKAGIRDATQPATVVQQLKPRADEFARSLPAGYAINIAGPVEESAKSQGPIAAIVPLMLLVMATILMIQIQSFQRLFLVVAVRSAGVDRRRRCHASEAVPLSASSPSWAVLALIGILIPQFRHPDRPNRGPATGRTGRLGVRRRGHPASDPPDPAHGRSCEPRPVPDLAGSVLGPHGVRNDGWHHRRNGADATIPPGPLRGLVPDQAGRLQLSRTRRSRTQAANYDESLFIHQCCSASRL